MAQIGFKGGEKLQAALREIERRLGQKAVVKVGFQNGATYPDKNNTLVAMVAAIQNYGAPEASIPARPFFSWMVRDKSPDWGDELGSILVAANYDADLALARMGLRIEGQLVDSIVEFDAVPLAQSTIDAKGFDKQLIHTTHMKNSITSLVERE